MMRSVVRRRSQERGAAAVEGGLVVGFVIAPILAAVLYLGYLLFLQQSVSLNPTSLPVSQVQGVCSSQQIIDRVKATASDAIFSANQNVLSGLGITSASQLANYLAVTVAQAPSLAVGVDVSVALDLPLPGLSPDLRTDLTQRLSYVQLGTGTSGVDGTCVTA